MKECVFAGTFDPFTVGHSDVVEKCRCSTITIKNRCSTVRSG